MDAALDVKYARTRDGLYVAYATMGDGPPDIVYLIAGVTHLRLNQDEPLFRRYEEKLTSFCRLVMMDERGAGMSDPLPSSEPPTLEERMDDVRAVLDALGIERATLFGYVDGGPLAMLFAATYPERVDRLILYCSYAALTAGPDYPIGFAAEFLDRMATRITEVWPDLGYELWAPSSDQAFRRRWTERTTSVSSPARAAAVFRRSYGSDVRPVLSSITVPTLVLHREGSRVIPMAMGQYLADHIAGARFVALPGQDTYPFIGDVDALVAETEEFVTGERSAPVVDRILATVLFTDIVDSTRQAGEIGDGHWRVLLDDHDAMVRRQLERFEGREVKTTGDGFFAAFDGPARAVRCAWAVRDGARRLGLDVRAGIHTGECEVRGDDLAGIAVHLGARIGSLAQAGEILVSRTVVDLVAGSGIGFEDRGAHHLKGIPGEWRVYSATG